MRAANLAGNTGNALLAIEDGAGLFHARFLLTSRRQKIIGILIGSRFQFLILGRVLSIWQNSINCMLRFEGNRS